MKIFILNVDLLWGCFSLCVCMCVCVCTFDCVWVCVHTVPAAVSLPSILLCSSCQLQSTLGVNLRQEAVGLLVTFSFLRERTISLFFEHVCGVNQHVCMQFSVVSDELFIFHGLFPFDSAEVRHLRSFTVLQRHDWKWHKCCIWVVNTFLSLGCELYLSFKKQFKKSSFTPVINVFGDWFTVWSLLTTLKAN